MGSRVATKKRRRFWPHLDIKNEWFLGALQGITVAVLLYMLLWCLPAALAKKEQCGDLGGLYKNGSCYKVSGGIPLG